MTKTNKTDTSARDNGATFRTVTGLVGLALMAGGLWMAWPPLALIVPGALLFVLASAAGIVTALRKES